MCSYRAALEGCCNDAVGKVEMKRNFCISFGTDELG